MNINTLYAFIAAVLASAVAASDVSNLRSDPSLSRKKKKHHDDPDNGKKVDSIIGATVTIGHLVHDPSSKWKEEDAVADAFRKAYNKIHLEDNHQLEEAVVQRSIFFPEDDGVAAEKPSWSFWPNIITPRWSTNDGSIFDIIAKGNMQRLAATLLPTQIPPETHEMHKLLEAEVCKNVRESDVDAMKEAMHCQILYTYTAVDEAAAQGSSEPLEIADEENMGDNSILQEQVTGTMGVVFQMRRFLSGKESMDPTHQDLIANAVVDAYNDLREDGACYLTTAAVQRVMEVPSDESKEGKHDGSNRPSLFAVIDSFRGISPFDGMYWLSVNFTCVSALEESHSLQATLFENLALVDASVHRSFESRLCDKINMGGNLRYENAQDCSVSFSLDFVVDTE